ncbi:MAG: DUF1906 domain-containing protein [Acidobacteriaceae bacterium]|nr:DUF1906 domain-containing protein [Acidobacteriaceae bacterium]
MLKRLQVGLLLCLVSQEFLAAQIVPSPVTSGHLSNSALVDDAQLISPSHGWVLSGGRLLSTATNGAQWADITPPSLTPATSIDGVFFLDESHAWVVLHASSDLLANSIYTAATGDGGQTWTTSAVAGGDQDVSHMYGAGAHIFFIDRTNGWLFLRRATSSAGSRGWLYSSTDGGQNWRLLPEPPAYGPVHFTSRTVGWLAGGPNNVLLYASRDGGLTWTEERVTPPAGTHSVREVFELPVFDDLNSGTLAVTFSVMPAAHPPFPPRDLVAVYTTTDSGATWSLQHSYRRNTLADSQIVDSKVIDVFSVNGVLVVGPDKEKNIAPLPSLFAGASMLSVGRLSFVDANNGWLVLSDHRNCSIPGCQTTTALLSTVDGGRTFITALYGAATYRGLPMPSRWEISAETAPSVSMQETTVTPGPGYVAHVNPGAQGLDSCSDMENILGGLEQDAASYESMGFYLGGLTATLPKVSCFVPYPPSQDIWLKEMSCIGYFFEPIWDDLQAPCSGNSQLISTNVSIAAAEGTASADEAANALASRGFGGMGAGGTSIAYLDIEVYNPPAGDTTCSPAVRAFVNSWIAEMHKDGYQAGVYANPVNINNDMSPGAIANVPDDIWGALANKINNANMPPVPAGWWINSQRTHQYNIAQPIANVSPVYLFDYDFVNGAVLTYANNYSLCQTACTNPCNPSCPDYAPGDPLCNPTPPSCDCYECEGESGPECCCASCGLLC